MTTQALQKLMRQLNAWAKNAIWAGECGELFSPALEQAFVIIQVCRTEKFVKADVSSSDESAHAKNKTNIQISFHLYSG